MEAWVNLHPIFVSVIKSGSVGFELFGLFVCLFDLLNCFPMEALTTGAGSKAILHGHSVLCRSDVES